MENARTIRKLLKRYVANTCSREEQEFVFEYLKTPEGIHHLKAVMDEKVGNEYEPIDPAISDRVFVKLLSSMESSGNNRSITPFGQFYTRTVWKIAAAFLGLLMIAGAAYMTTKKDIVTYTTAYGQVKTIILPDSSVVTLNANSTLSYDASDWEETKLFEREVSLEGEAFFSVLKKPFLHNAKFIVHSEDMDVEVLGTKFNVHNRRGRTQVVLNSGKVKLNSAYENIDGLIMKPGEFVAFSKKTKEFIKKNVDPKMYISWRNNKLIFNKTPLRKIAVVLEDNYGYEVVFEDKKMMDRKFTGVIPADNIDILLTTLSKLFNAQINKKDKQIIMATRSR